MSYFRAMPNSIHISTNSEYNYCINRGYQPLVDPLFVLSHELRVGLQNKLFEDGCIPASNSKFYHFMWENRPHHCEECLKPLHSYSAAFISHILSRGAHPAMAHDPRNVNILCFFHHTEWENGNRTGMRIYNGNMRIIDVLLNEYKGK